MSSLDIGQLRHDLRAWLKENWEPELPLIEWRERLVDSGWGRPSWPTEWYGRGLAPAADLAAERVLLEEGAVGVAFGPGALLAGPTLLEHGSDSIKARLLKPVLLGTHQWCQLFSEPDAGSDLASLRTRAIRDGDRWIINGQKLWSSSAHHADRGMLIARTQAGSSRNAGLTYFAIDMHQPGIEVRPIRQMNGYASFNEVFFVDAVATDDDIVGEIDNGWAVVRTTLANERRLNLARRVAAKGASGRAVDEARAESREAMSPYMWYPQRAGRADLLVDYARRSGRSDDPIVRQEIARVLSLMRCAEWTAERARAARAAGRPPGPEGSLGKMHSSLIAKAAAGAHALIAGIDAVDAGPDPAYPLVAEVLTSVPAVSIAGGTDEIQKNIIAERILGLPRDSSQPSGEGSQ